MDKIGFNIKKIRELILTEKDDINQIINDLNMSLENERQHQVSIIKSVG